MDPQLVRSPATAADYGYDAPYALVIFAVIGAAGTFGAIVAWREGDRHLTAVMSFYAVFFWETRSASLMRHAAASS
jgi:hypothetical protein